MHVAVLRLVRVLQEYAEMVPARPPLTPCDTRRDNAAMLPDGFAWTDSTEPALMFNGRRLAFVTNLPQHPGVIYGARIEINPDLAKRRTHFEASLTDGIAYVETWACK